METIDATSFAPTRVDDIVFGNDEAKMRITEITKGYKPFPVGGKNGISGLCVHAGVGYGAGVAGPVAADPAPSSTRPRNCVPKPPVGRGRVEITSASPISDAKFRSLICFS